VIPLLIIILFIPLAVYAVLHVRDNEAGPQHIAFVPVHITEPEQTFTVHGEWGASMEPEELT